MSKVPGLTLVLLLVILANIFSNCSGSPNRGQKKTVSKVCKCIISAAGKVYRMGSAHNAKRPPKDIFRCLCEKDFDKVRLVTDNPHQFCHPISLTL